MNIANTRKLILSSSLFKNSLWAVFGNGMGNALMLLSGIIIARFLGKDLYGEYGVVKTTMFYIGGFAALGLGFTTTRYIANAVESNPHHLKSIIRSSMKITLAFSGIIAFLFLVFAPTVASFMEEDGLTFALRVLAVIIVFKAITTTQIGLLSGFKDFRHIAYNSLYSGIFMLVLCIPLTYFLGLEGSLAALLFSQMFNALINYYSVRKYTISLKEQIEVPYFWEIIKFSFPVALQESSYVVCNWIAIMLLTKYASVGDVGLYTVGAQWKSIVLMIPTLLSNVILSYLSGNLTDAKQHGRTVNRMLLVNFTTTLVPFLAVYFLAEFIASFYGPTFSSLSSLMPLMVSTTILECCTNVFKSELMAQGRTWLLFLLRFVRDLTFAGLVYFVFALRPSNNGAFSYAWCSIVVTTCFFIAMWIVCKLSSNTVAVKN